MVAEVASIEVTLKLLGIDQYQSGMRGAGSVTEQTGQRVSRTMDSIANSTGRAARATEGMSRGDGALRSLSLSALRAETSIVALTRGLQAAGVALGGLAGGVAVNAFRNYADQATNIQNRLATVIPVQQERLRIENEIYQSAQRSRTSYEATANLFSRLTLSSTQLGSSQAQNLRVVETTQKALIAGGATVQEAAAVATQLTQALGSGRLNGDELKSIAENSPVLIQAIATEFGVSVGALKEMGSKGELEAKRVFSAIMKSTDDVERMFGRTTPTIAAGIQQVDNALVRYIGSVDKSLGATKALVSGLEFVAANLSNIGDSAGLAIAAVAGSLLGRGAGRAVTAVRRPFVDAREAADARVESAEASRQQARYRQQAAYNQYFQALAKKEVVEATPALALAGAKPIADLEAAEKRLAGSRYMLQTETTKLAAAEAARDAAANASVDVKKRLADAEQSAAKAVGNSQQRVAAQAMDYQVAAGGVLSAEGSLGKRETEQLAKATAERAAAQARMVEIDSATAAARDQVAALSTPTAGPIVRKRAAREAELNADIEQMTSGRNRLGLALRAVEEAASQREEQLAQVNLAAKKKHADEFGRVGEALVAAERKVADQRKVVAERAAEVTGYSATGKAQSPDTVLKQIEREISAQEKLAELEAKSAALGSQYKTLMDQGPQVSGSLKPDQVRDLNASRTQRDAMIRELAQMDSDLDAKRQERDALEQRTGPAGRRKLAIDAENATKVGSLNAGLTAAAAEREKLAEKIEQTNATIENLEGKQAERTAAARQTAVGKAQAAADSLRKVQATLVQDLDVLNQRRAAVAADEVENESKRARQLAAIDSQIEQRRKQIGEVKTAASGFEAGAQRAREAIELSAQGKIEQADRAAKSAAASIEQARAAADRAADSLSSAQRAATIGAVFMQGLATRSVDALKGLVGFLGGPLGAAMTAASVGIAGYMLYQARAEEQVKKHADAVKVLIERTEALNKAEGAGKLRGDRQLVEDTTTAKNSIRSTRDVRESALTTLRGALALRSRGQSAGAPGEIEKTGLDDAASRAGTSVDDLFVKLRTLDPNSTEAVENLRTLADVLLDAAKADPKFAERALEMDDLAKKGEAAVKAVKEYNLANQAATDVKLPTPLDFPGPFTIQPTFNAEAGNAAVTAYLKEIGDEIDEINGTPIRLQGVDTSAAEIRELVEAMAAGRAQVLGLVSGASIPTFLSDAIASFKTGSTNSAEFGAKLQELKEKYPDFSPLIQSLIESNERILNAQASAQALGVNLDSLDGRVVNILVKMATSGKVPNLAGELAKEQASADKVLADMDFKARIAVLKAGGHATEAAIEEQKKKTPLIDTTILRDKIEAAARNEVYVEAEDKRQAGQAAAIEAAASAMQETAETRLKARGQEREAAIRRYKRENPYMDADLAGRVAAEQFDAEQELSESKKKGQKGRKSPEQREAETLERKLRELDQDARVSALDSFDQKTVRFAQDAKVASDQIEAFITAARSGDLSGIPPVMQQIYEKMMLLEGVRLAKSSLDEIYPYRKLARELETLRAAANASPEIAANIDLIEMNLRAKNAPEWVSGLSDGIKEAAKAAAEGSATIGNIMETLRKRIMSLAFDTAFKPIEMGLKAALSSLTEGAGGNFFSSLLGGGSGGAGVGDGLDLSVGADSNWVGFDDGGYTGFGPRKKVAGIVHAGEVVFSQDDVARHGGVQRVERHRKSGLPGFEKGGAVGMAGDTLRMTAATAARQDMRSVSDARPDDGGGVIFQTQIFNQTPAKVEVREIQDGRGGRRQEVLITEAFVNGARSPQGQQALKQQPVTRR